MPTGSFDGYGSKELHLEGEKVLPQGEAFLCSDYISDYPVTATIAALSTALAQYTETLMDKGGAVYTLVWEKSIAYRIIRWQRE